MCNRLFKKFSLFGLLVLCSLNWRFITALPIILEGDIDLKTFIVKAKKASESFLSNLEVTYGRAVAEALEHPITLAESFEAANYLGIPRESIEKAIIVSPAVEEGEKYYLVATLATLKSVLNEFRNGDKAFLEIILPVHFSQPVELFNKSTPRENLSEEKSVGDNPGVGAYTVGENRSVTSLSDIGNRHHLNIDPKQAPSHFLSRFIEVDTSDENFYIPKAVRQTLSTSHQVLVKPPSYIYRREGTTSDYDQSYYIGSRQKVDVVMSLFIRHNY